MRSNVGSGSPGQCTRPVCSGTETSIQARCELIGPPHHSPVHYQVMKLGVDFGTNRIVVAAADRGNYPLVSFESVDGGTADWFPSLIAVRQDERVYGWQAWEKQAVEGWTVIRSIKRLLERAGPQSLVDLDDQQIPLSELLNGL